MAIITALPRLVLMILTGALTVIGIVMVTCGLIIKYYLGKVIKSGVFSEQQEKAFRVLGRGGGEPDNIEFGPLTDGIGIALAVIGCFLIVTGLVGFLIGYMALVFLLPALTMCLGLLVFAEIIILFLFLLPLSQIHDTAKTTLLAKLHSDYNRQKINDFTMSADILFIGAGCCGVKGPKDFENMKVLNFVNPKDNVNIEPLVPPSCCKWEEFVTQDWASCSKDYSKSYSMGCYEKLQEMVAAMYPWLIPTILITFLVEIGINVLGCLMILDVL